MPRWQPDPTGLRMTPSPIAAIIAQARRDHRRVLLEPEGVRLLQALGIATPAMVFVEPGSACPASALNALPGPRVVVKIVSPDILHKTEAGGVAIADKTPGDVAAVMAEMSSRNANARVDGFLVCEFVPYRPELGHEFLLGLRGTQDAGAVVSLGPSERRSTRWPPSSS